MDLYIPTVGVTTVCRKILSDKRRKGKTFDESFAKVASFIIPDWRGLDESVYDQYERASNEWSPLQFSIADQITEKINFATKSGTRSSSSETKLPTLIEPNREPCMPIEIKVNT